MSRPRTRSTPNRTAAPAPKAGPGPKRKRAIAKKKAEAAPKTDAQRAAAQEARTLSGRAARYLRGLGHHLDPIVQIGKDGITEGVVSATRTALLAHELVKVKVLAEAPLDRKEAGADLAERAGAALAQVLGRTFLLYKRHPNKPKIVVPR
jgi:RNA-binding protein